MRVPRWNMFVSTSGATEGASVVGRRLIEFCSWSVPRPRTTRRVFRVARKDTAYTAA
jgi:hypothetical protein